MTPILNAYRGLLLGGQTGFSPQFYVAAAVSATLLVGGWLLFRRLERRFGELA